MPKKITITISDDAALWARQKAAAENTSLSKLVGKILERQMRLTDDYWRAFDRWKARRAIAGAGAAERMSRDQTHDRT